MPPGGKSKSLPRRGGRGTAPPFIDNRGVKPLGPRTGLLLTELPFPNRTAGSRLRLETFFNFFSATCSRDLPGFQTQFNISSCSSISKKLDNPSEKEDRQFKANYAMNTEDHNYRVLGEKLRIIKQATKYLQNVAERSIITNWCKGRILTS